MLALGGFLVSVDAPKTLLDDEDDDNGFEQRTPLVEYFLACSWMLCIVALVYVGFLAYMIMQKEAKFEGTDCVVMGKHLRFLSGGMWGTDEYVGVLVFPWRRRPLGDCVCLC
mmetsp:Transcript_83117/g.222111  ORF Transcript_83117/g.222111 Transcript_83117/m.222111 type:complete len:112 (+) Transcript_83117:59-394(+)